MSKVTFIGTSHGIPERDRRTSATMLEFGEDIYFIDAGTDISDAMIRLGKDVTRVKAIFTTHVHGDHTAGLMPTVNLFNWCYTSTDVDIFLTSERLGAIIKDYCEEAGHVFATERLRFRLAKAGEVYEDGNVKVIYYPTKHIHHLGLPSYAILVVDKKEGKRLLFSGDMSMRLCEGDFPVEPLSVETDLFVCEMAHLRVEHILPYLKDAKIKRMYINHYRAADKYPELPSDAAMISEEYKIPTVIATDWMEIEV